MPAVRTKSSRRKEDGQFVWTLPIEQVSSGIAFAPNITPVTYNDSPPPLVDAPPFESILFPPSENISASSRPGHGKKRPDNHIPRPPNAFILFRSSFIKSQHVSTEVETNHSTLSKIIGLTWQNLPNEERQIWHAKAKAALDEHKRKFPQYAFKPAHNKGKGGCTGKRKVREVGPKDLKRCVKIAELLVEGKKGTELDAAIQEFDKHHVPEVVTRFEAPITARAYRRSSSVPAPDDSQTQPFLFSSPRPSQKLRASSVRPTQHVATPSPVPSPSYLVSYASQEQADGIYPHSFHNAPSFHDYSFPSVHEHSFDFNTFSFETLVSPAPIFGCDTLSENVGDSVNPLDTMFPGRGNPSRPEHLSINTAFLGMDSWTRCSTPMSASTSSMPTTPSYRHTSSSLGTSSSMMDSFDPLLAQPFENMSTYMDNCSSPFSVGEFYASSPSEFDSFQQAHSKVPMANADLEFSAFMASQYPL